eukprot:CAMPEP_0202883088 /NCGR_PEP_ID=MMETSP1391-20130828/38944_1 /ASSEMBLY_ACC=CAM_ASM_000867 /TAXON_ID=1034604 /ORGANISM="Chlamydomonas leiostraca, Strain SAG 11-49" /LENGTH=34 /DNA_ID= /DNA_START= /DNA_END= /DNA_ORIENTATION=
MAHRAHRAVVPTAAIDKYLITCDYPRYMLPGQPP